MPMESAQRRTGTALAALLIASGWSHPGSAQVDSARADSLFGVSEWGAAAEAYAGLVRQNADDGRIWFRLGFARHQAGDHAGAIEALEKANELEFAPPRVRYRLALAHLRLGDHDAALRWLHGAVEAGFTNLGVLRTDPELEPLRGTPGFAALMQVAQSAHACSRDECRQFDFWVGSWEVFNPAGARVGRNHIRRVENGCALSESWTSARGGTGSSINFYHPGRGKWVQTWFDGNGGVIDLEGELRDGAMHLRGTNFSSDGTHELIRGTWTPLADGRVRQFFEQSRDQGATWYVWFDGYYVRQNSDRPGN
jgi:hypothetical protein